ncbi:MAG: hypothetical protein ACYSWQ_29425, partial [Planctomycetota bacterium]
MPLLDIRQEIPAVQFGRRQQPWLLHLLKVAICRCRISKRTALMAIRSGKNTNRHFAVGPLVLTDKLFASPQSLAY